MEGVVRRAVLAGPRPGRERVPADARVGREALEQAVLALDAVRDELLHRVHRTGGGVLVHEIRPHPVGCKQHDLVCERPLLLGRGGRASAGCRDRHQKCCDQRSHCPYGHGPTCHRSSPSPDVSDGATLTRRAPKCKRSPYRHRRDTGRRQWATCPSFRRSAGTTTGMPRSSLTPERDSCPGASQCSIGASTTS